MLLLIWTVVLFAALALYLRQVYSRFSSYGVKTIRPVPIMGNMLGVFTRRCHIVDDIKQLYFKFPEEKFVGRYELLYPMLVLRDLDLIKKITVKDFEYFLDHRGLVDEKNEPFFARNLFALRGQEWKDMRSTLSPAFTSSKIKLMVPFMDEVGKQMIKALEKKIEASGGYMDIDVKDLTTRYANDVIASCAFGLKVDSHTDENNTFYEMGKTASTFKLKQILLMWLYMSCPAVVKRLNLTLFTDATKKFFTNIVLDTMGEREAKNIVRPDMIHLLMQAKKGQLSHEEPTNGSATKDAGFSVVEESAVGKKNPAKVWSDDDLIAQAVLFFIAGFETISSAMSFCLHEIAMHPEIQERLVQEIKEFDAKNNGKIDYTSIQNMVYLDMVVSEVLRFWPPGVALDRICVKDYNLGKPNEKAARDYIIRKGESVAIPAWAIHHDPEYFPNPEKFDPERFSEENKHQINPFAYMPFGLGPRNCIGSRFALCELKVMVYQILLRMKLSASEKLQQPVMLARDSFNIKIEGGHWVRFEVRN